MKRIRGFYAFVLIDQVDGEETERVIFSSVGANARQPMIGDDEEKLQFIFGDEARQRAIDRGLPLRIIRCSRMEEPAELSAT